MASMTDVIFLLLIFFYDYLYRGVAQCHKGVASARQTADFGKTADESNH